jgi:hypothetical protein
MAHRKFHYFFMVRERITAAIRGRAVSTAVFVKQGTEQGYFIHKISLAHLPRKHFCYFITIIAEFFDAPDKLNKQKLRFYILAGFQPLAA